LIQDPESIFEIQKHIDEALKDTTRLINAQNINAAIAREQLDYSLNQSKVVELYENL
jgi:hypothetical protein